MQLILGKSMHLLSLAGKDAVLAAPNKSGLIAPTSGWSRPYATSSQD
jgi:hypothetical protein